MTSAIRSFRMEVGRADPLEGLRRGERVAMRECYRQHAGAIRAFAFRLTGDEDAAKDLTQDVFVALPAAIARFRGEGSLRSYLVSMAANMARRHVRVAARRRSERADVDLVSTQPSPELSAYDRQLAGELSRAMDRLPLKLRIAFVTVVIEGYDGPEAARILGLPEATLRTRVFRARQALRETLIRRGVEGAR
ncbi:MAG: RNA polymerase sigma factor [Sandaracinaceae bacterium]